MNNNNYRKEFLHHKIHKHAKNHIHRMRNRPEHHKKAYAFVVSLSVTLFVFMLWYFMSLPKILLNYQIDKSENQRLGNSIGDNIVNDFKEVFTNTDSQINNDINTEELNIEIKE